MEEVEVEESPKSQTRSSAMVEVAVWMQRNDLEVAVVAVVMLERNERVDWPSEE